MSARTAILKSGEQTIEIKLAHSPDSDDAFMFYALATHKLPTPGYKYTHVLSDIQTLNEAALTETYDVTAVSFAAYPSIRPSISLIFTRYRCSASIKRLAPKSSTPSNFFSDLMKSSKPPHLDHLCLRVWSPLSLNLCSILPKPPMTPIPKAKPS